jgi:hypothetical protein
MPDFTKSNPALEAKIAACRTKEDLDEVLRTHTESLGMPASYDRYPVPARTEALQPSADVPKDDGILLRKAVTLPDGRIQLIEAYSHYGLDILEAALRKQS